MRISELLFPLTKYAFGIPSAVAALAPGGEWGRAPGIRHQERQEEVGGSLFLPGLSTSIQTNLEPHAALF